MTDDHRLMTAALSLARRGLGQTWPNPAVGCILGHITPDGGVRMVGQGWTQPGGRPHAEAMALAEAGPLAHGATAWVTLEPCAHHGQTPPCADALIAAGLRHCVVAVADPDPRVNGRGLARLRAAGITVTENIGREAALDLNRGFFIRQALGRPWVALKVAASLDGRIALANGSSQWITGTAARAWGHGLRASFDGILAGTGTLLQDDPALTCRLPGLERRHPQRILLDRQGRLSPAARALTAPGPRPWLVTARPDHPAADTADLIVLTPDPDTGRLPLPELLQELGRRGLTRLLVEGGGVLGTALLQAGCVDELFWFTGPVLLGADSVSAVGMMGLASLPAGWHVRERHSFSDDQVIILRADAQETHLGTPENG
jgi:diaminohydroxyphosphoribosylaminopyrimidine deaminase / 5-amino-6-(5-phosphoribosylamino)uracil reductase